MAVIPNSAESRRSNPNVLVWPDYVSLAPESGPSAEGSLSSAVDPMLLVPIEYLSSAVGPKRSRKKIRDTAINGRFRSFTVGATGVAFGPKLPLGGAIDLAGAAAQSGRWLR